MKRRAISKAVRERVHQKYNGHCAYCGCEITIKEMQIDHILPVDWYCGEDAETIDNYNPSCRMCNFYKGTLTKEGLKVQLLELQRRLDKIYIYRLAKKYGLISENKNEVKFYFEKEAKASKDGEK